MRTAIARLVCLVLCVSCGAPRAGEDTVSTVSGRLREPGWVDENRVRLERMLAALSVREGRRVAVFDWDNTMMRGDIGDLVLARAIERSSLRWSSEHVAGDAPTAEHFALLTPAGRAAIERACADAVDRAGTTTLRTSIESECARALAHLAWRAETPDGEPAFTIPLGRFHRATYGFMAQLSSSQHTDDELRALARDVWSDASDAPIGSRRMVGGVEIDRFARLHTPMVELAHALEAAGVEVWFVSASLQPIVEALAETAGFARDRVIGVRMEHDAHGRSTARFATCGEGPLETPVMTWHEGKRAWINRVIFEVPPERQRERQRDPALRPVFAAGDSDGDLAMLQDATVLRLVLDRQNPRVMCNALAHPAEWLVQPLFVDPMPARSEPYPCAAFVDVLGPILDEDGRAIADQRASDVDGVRSP